MRKRIPVPLQEIERPTVGEYYINPDRVIVEVRAVSDVHVVCDAERLYDRATFDRTFKKAMP